MENLVKEKTKYFVKLIDINVNIFLKRNRQEAVTKIIKIFTISLRFFWMGLFSFQIDMML